MALMVAPTPPELLPAAPAAGEPDQAIQVFIVGKKRSGKSEYTWVLWDSYDGDEVVIDVTGDFLGKHPDPEVIQLETPPPGRWPERLRVNGQRMKLCFTPNIDDPDWREQCDRVINMAYEHGHCLLVIEEVGQVGPVGLPFPGTRKALHHGGHVGLNIVANGPRAIGIDPLWISQADEVVTFKLLSPRDRKRVAENIDWDQKEFEELAKGLRVREHLRFQAALDPPELWLCEPLKLPDRQTAAAAYVDEQEEEEQ